MLDEFLKFLRPDGGLITLTAIPKGRGLVTETFDLSSPMGIADAVEWAEAWNADRYNIYYQLQLLKRAFSGRGVRPKEEDVKAVPFVHLDYDWKDEEGNRIAATPEMIAAKAEEFRAWKLPSALIVSGNGLQVLYRLQIPVSTILQDI